MVNTCVISFIPRNSRKSKKGIPIYCRIKIGKTIAEFSTKIRAKEGLWNNEFKRLSPKAEYSDSLNQSLDELDKKLKDLGDKGELYVMDYEKERLQKNNKKELIEMIKHVSLSNDSAGYDILSYNEDGTERFIEVKTTKGPEGTDFYISPGELNFSKENENFYIYRVYEFLPEKMIGKIYMKKGSVEENFNLTPLQYKVSL